MKRSAFFFVLFLLTCSVVVSTPPAFAGHAGIWKATDGSNNYYIQTYEQKSGIESIAVIATPDLISFHVFLGTVINGYPLLNDDPNTGASLTLTFTSATEGTAVFTLNGTAHESPITQSFVEDCENLTVSSFMDRIIPATPVGSEGAGQAGIWKANDNSINFYIQTYAGEGGSRSIAVVATPDLIQFYVFLGTIVDGVAQLNPDPVTGAELSLEFSSLTQGTATLIMGGSTAVSPMTIAFTANCRDLSLSGGSGDGWSSGYVSLDMSTYAGEFGDVYVDAYATFASFSQEPQWYEDPSAAVRDIPLDTCVFNSYDMDSSGIEIPGLLDAGDYVDVSGGPSGTISLVKTTTTAGPSYAPEEDLTEADYGAGSTYTFSSSGGSDVGPFSVSVKAPDPVQLIYPVLGSTPPSIPRNQDLNVQWNAGSGSEVEASISATKLDLQNQKITYYEIYCRFSDDGEGTIPASELSKMPDLASPGPIPFTSPSYFDLIRYNTASFSASGLSQGGFAAISTGMGGDINLE